MSPAKAARQYTGVVYDRSKNSFRAMIRVERKLHHLGYFKHAVLAALAYDDAASDVYGDPNRLNFATTPVRNAAYWAAAAAPGVH